MQDILPEAKAGKRGTPKRKKSKGKKSNRKAAIDRKKRTAFHRRVYPEPKDFPEARAAMFRMMCDITNSWKECPLRVCRRQRECRGETFACYTPGPPMPAHLRDKARFELGQMLDAEIARRAALRGEGERESHEQRK